MQVSITIKGNAEAISKLSLLKGALAEYSTELKNTGDFLKQYYENYPFASEGQVWGKSWDRLNPAYEAAKANKYRGKRILEASGKMRQSFEFMSTGDYCRIYNNTDYFKYHQLGTSRMPQRLVMSLNAATNAAIATIFKEGINLKLEALAL